MKDQIKSTPCKHCGKLRMEFFVAFDSPKRDTFQIVCLECIDAEANRMLRINDDDDEEFRDHGKTPLNG